MEYILDKIKENLSDHIDVKTLDRLSEPPSHIEADLSLPLESPDRAKDIKDQLKSKEFSFLESFDTVNNFLNITLNKKKVYHHILSEVLDLGLGYGASDKNSGKSAFIEYSSPNIAKPIGVGHLRSTIIGESISRIYEATGFNVWRENFLGDWGTPFGKVLVAYRKWGDESTLEENPLKNLKDLYVKFQNESKKDESLLDEAREAFKKLEDGDKETVEVWKKFRKISLEEYKKVYDNLGIEFDNHSGESKSADRAKDEISLCLDKEVCDKTENGAVVVEDLDDLPSFLLQKEDGSTLYAARDLAELKSRIEKHDPDEILYVVGSEQDLYFKQLFALADAMDYLKDTVPKHVSFGLITVDGEKMSTRRGTLVELDELFNKATAKARKLVEEKNSELDKDEKNRIAREVGMGSIIYNDLSQQRSKNISFDWDQMLNLNAGSGPYLQYTYARIKSILRNLLEGDDYNSLLKEEVEGFSLTFEDIQEFRVAKKIAFFPDIILSSAQNRAPHILCNFLEDLGLEFNSFYSSISIKETEEEDLKISRLVLSFATAQVIKKGLHLLNIKTPERM